MKIYDISLNLSPETVRWITAQPFELIERKRKSRGDANNSSSMHTSVHAGTHVDAPFHFVDDGATIEQLPPDLFMGPARVCAVDVEREIGSSDVARLALAGEKRVLFKTRNSSLLHKPEYDPSFVAFSVGGARALADLVFNWSGSITFRWLTRMSRCRFTGPFWIAAWYCWRVSIFRACPRDGMS